MRISFFLIILSALISVNALADSGKGSRKIANELHSPECAKTVRDSVSKIASKFFGTHCAAGRIRWGTERTDSDLSVIGSVSVGCHDGRNKPPSMHEFTFSSGANCSDIKAAVDETSVSE